MSSLLKLISITFGFIFIIFGVVFLSVSFVSMNFFIIGMILLILGILFIVGGVLFFSNQLSKFNFQLQKYSSLPTYINQVSYKNPYKSINTLNGFQNNKRQSGIIMLIMGIILTLFVSSIIGIVLLYISIKLFMNKTQLNLKIQSSVSSISDDDRDGFEDEYMPSNANFTGYIGS